MIIGIDLGTTFSAVSYINEDGNPEIIQNREGERTTPSVIFFEDDLPIVGSAAKSMAGSDPFNTVQFVKRQMGNLSFKHVTETDITYLPEELSAIILKRLKKDAELALGKEVKQAVITVPAYFNDSQRKATIDAGRIAGLEVLKVINEPTAAALAYGFTRLDDPQRILVYDLGGGTFDVTILEIDLEEVRVLSTAGQRNLGGFDFDNKIISYIQESFEKEHGIDLYEDEFALQELRDKAEAAKRQLTSRNKAIIVISSQGKMLKTEITREQFTSMIKPLLNRTVGFMENVLEEAQLTWGDINKVLLVGGSTRIPAVTAMIEEVTGITPSGELNPDEVVALGAAIQTTLLEEYSEVNSETGELVFTLPKTKVIDVNSHSLGTLTYDEDENFINDIILPRNSSLPASSSEEYTTRYDGQEEVEIELTEGEDSNPDYVTIIGKTTVRFTESKPKGYPIIISVSYDENGLIQLNAKDGKTNKMLGDISINRNANLTDEAVEEKMNKLSKLKVD